MGLFHLYTYMEYLSFLHVRDSYLYLQVHLLDQVKRAANLRVYLSLVAELCSSNTPTLWLGGERRRRRFRANLKSAAKAAHEPLREL